MKKSILTILLVLAGLLVTLVAGCSSSDSGSPVAPPVASGDTGNVRIEFAWPATRTIPVGTKSIYVSMVNNDGFAVDDRSGIAVATVDPLHPDMKKYIEFAAMPTGTYTVSASAWDNATPFLPGASVLAAASNRTAVVSKGQLNHIDLILADKIINITVYGPSSIKVGGNATGSVVAYFDGDVVNGYPINNSKCTWVIHPNGTAATISNLSPNFGRVLAGATVGTGVTYTATTKVGIYPTVSDTCAPFPITTN